MDHSPPPPKIGDDPVLRWSPIDSRHRVTGNCSHVDLSTGVEDPIPANVAIVHGEHGFFLIRFDSEWQFITDTWHETLSEALHQAEFEYEGVSGTWQNMSDE